MAKGSIKTARKYAQALSELYPVPELDQVLAGLKGMEKILSENSMLSQAMANPAFNIDQRVSVMKAIAENTKSNDQKFANFISLLTQAGRISEIKLIITEFSTIIDQIKKLLSLKVTSAFDISGKEKEEFKNHLQKEFGSLATVEWDKDESIIGGLRVRAGDKLLDSSIKGALQRLENTLLT